MFFKSFLIQSFIILLLVYNSCKSQKQKEIEDQADIKEVVIKFFEYVKKNDEESFNKLLAKNTNPNNYIVLTDLYNKSLVKERKLPKEFKLIYEETKLGGELGIIKDHYVRIPYYIFPNDNNKLRAFSSFDVLIYFDKNIVGDYKKIYDYDLDYKLREDKEKIHIDGGL
ncbi:MAG: hypothetical protein ACEQSF_04355 [Solirubrobacteraceae bacterium]